MDKIMFEYGQNLEALWRGYENVTMEKIVLFML
jgi:hypothetical protein